MFAVSSLFARRGSPGRTHRAKLVLGGVLALVGLCGLTSQAKADFTFEMNNVFDKDPDIDPGRTFAEATFVQVNSTTVKLTLTANLIGDEFISKMAFNYADDENVSLLVFSADAANSTVAGPVLFDAETDKKTADGATQFDIEGLLPTGENDNRFEGTETLVFYITRADGLDVDDFNTANEGNKSPIFFAVHVQSTTVHSDGSLWAGDGDGGDTPDTQEVPIPPSAALLALGFAGVGFTGWRRRKKADA